MSDENGVGGLTDHREGTGRAALHARTNSQGLAMALFFAIGRVCGFLFVCA